MENQTRPAGQRSREFDKSMWSSKRRIGFEKSSSEGVWIWASMTTRTVQKISLSLLPQLTHRSKHCGCCIDRGSITTDTTLTFSTSQTIISMNVRSRERSHYDRQGQSSSSMLDPLPSCKCHSSVPFASIGRQTTDFRFTFELLVQARSFTRRSSALAQTLTSVPDRYPAPFREIGLDRPNQTATRSHQGYAAARQESRS